MIKAEKWSLPTVNISKCLFESQFCVIQTVFPDAFIRTYYPCRIWNSWCYIHGLRAERWDGDCSVIAPFPRVWRMVAARTRGNSCLGRRFLWASRSGHIHKARQEARWDRTSLTLRVCVCVCIKQDAWVHYSTTDSLVGIFGCKGAVTQTILESSPGSESGQVSKWVCYNRTKRTPVGRRGPQWPPEAFAVGTQKLLSLNAEGKGWRNNCCRSKGS